MNRKRANANSSPDVKLTEFEVMVVRVAGTDLITGTYLDEARETLEITAKDKQEAYKKSFFLAKLSFRGQLRRTFINGQEHFDERY